VRLVARTLMMHLIEQHQQRQLRQRQRQRQLIHPGGFIAALHHIDQLLKGSPKQFQEMFRLPKPQFWRLLHWLETNTGLTDTQYQTSAQKLLIFL
jgi:beta-galactosidase/beta-glucuronidase